MNWLPLRVAPVLLAVALVSVAAFTAANVVPATRVGAYGAAVSPNDLKPPECAALNLIEIRVSGGAGGGTRSCSARPATTTSSGRAATTASLGVPVTTA